MPIGSADKKCQVTSGHAPLGKLFGELFARPTLAAAVECDYMNIARQCSEYGRTFVLYRARIIATFAASARLQYD